MYAEELSALEKNGLADFRILERELWNSTLMRSSGYVAEDN